MSMSVGNNAMMIFFFSFLFILGGFCFFIDTKVNLANKTKQKLERTNQIKPGKTYGGEFLVG